jgi:hypothetical protein
VKISATSVPNWNYSVQKGVRLGKPSRSVTLYPVQKLIQKHVLIVPYVSLGTHAPERGCARPICSVDGWVGSVPLQTSPPKVTNQETPLSNENVLNVHIVVTEIRVLLLNPVKASKNSRDDSVKS